MTPKVMYHFSDPRQRNSIQRSGLDPAYDFTGHGAVYLSKTPIIPFDDEPADVWRVYTQGLDIEGDASTPSFEGEWFMTRDVISPDRLELMDNYELREKQEEGWSVASQVVQIETEPDEAHATQPGRIPWFWSPDLNVLFIGSGASSHTKILNAASDVLWPVSDNLWDGVYASGENVIVVFHQYDVSQFWEDELDPQMIAELKMAFPQADTIRFLDHDGDFQNIKVASEDYMGWPKYEKGDAVVMKAYGDSGQIQSARWSETDGKWWYFVNVYDQDGPRGLEEWPEEDLERASINFDRGPAMDQPSAWTLQDFGITPAAEDYYRHSKVDLLKFRTYYIDGKPYVFSGSVFRGTYKPLKLFTGDPEIDLLFDDPETKEYMRLTPEEFQEIEEEGRIVPLIQDDGTMTLDEMRNKKMRMSPDEAAELWPDTIPWMTSARRYAMIRRMGANQAQVDSIMNAYNEEEAARTATAALTQAGGKVYIVGGAVRDAFLGRTSKDVDLMCAGLPGETIEETLKNHGRVDLTGKAFGVYRFRMKSGSEVEIALPRTETSTGSGHKDFAVKTDHNLSPEEDLRRRDFTGNAMAFDPMNQELLDPFGGADDLAASRLRLVNDNALSDDPLRIVRALVANARFGLQPDEDLMDALAANAHKLKHLPAERIQMELEKLLAGKSPAEAMRIAEKTGLVDYMIPELAAAIGFDQMNPHHNLDVYSHTMAVLDKASQLSDDPDFRLAALFHDAGKPASFWRDETAPEGGGGHFYKKVMDDGTEIGQNHEEAGAELVEAFMRRIRYPGSSPNPTSPLKGRAAKVKKLVEMHMFPYFKTTGGARKFLAALDGDEETARDLLRLRESDASGKQNGQVSDYDRKNIDRCLALLDQVIAEKSALTVKDLAIGGRELMELGLKGPQIGQAQKKLLELVIDSPELNTREQLMALVKDGV